MNLSTQLAGNKLVDAKIKSLLPLLHADDQRKFLKKFKVEASEQKAHTFRELILGAFFARNGLRARYEIRLDGKTPDWLLYDTSGNVDAVVDQVTFHQARVLDDQMNSSMSNSQPWVGWLPDNTDRLYQKIQEKAEKYERLAKARSASSVIAVFADINASVELDEMQDALSSAHGGGLFSHVPSLSGVLLFTEASGSYTFHFFQSPHSTQSPFTVFTPI